MGMSSYDWPIEFRKVYDAGTERYLRGERIPAKLFSKKELEFLASIGCSAQELFDFIDDKARYGEPDYETTLLTTAVRRDYFMVETTDGTRWWIFHRLDDGRWFLHGCFD